jgi:23S rRNA (adenine2503-C2)-methyltransferase
MRWMHQMGEDDFDAMTDLAKSLRAKLHERAEVRVPSLMTGQASRRVAA